MFLMWEIMKMFKRNIFPKRFNPEIFTAIWRKNRYVNLLTQIAFFA